MSGQANANPYQFTGRENDSPLPLYFYRARYYSPTFSRFTTQDPIDFAGGDANLYAYGRENPLSNVDPLGLFVILLISPLERTPDRLLSSLSAFSTLTGQTVSGYTLENANPDNQDLPVPAGVYDASLRYFSQIGTTYNPPRIQLDVPDNIATGIELHIGNKPENVNGCFAVGTTIQPDLNLGGSRSELISLDSLFLADPEGGIAIVFR